MFEVIHPLNDALAGKLIDELRTRPDLVDTTWDAWLDSHKKADLETVAREAVQRSVPFYRALVALLKRKGYLRSAENREETMTVRG